MATVVGSVSVEVVPSARVFNRSLRAQVLPQVQRLGDDIGNEIAQRISSNIVNGVNQGLGRGLGNLPGVGAAGRRAGDEFAGGFDRALRSRIQSALRELPPVQIGPARNGDEQQLRDLTAELQSLRSQRVGIDIDAESARAQIEAIRVQLDALGARSPSIQVQADVAAASAQLAAVSAEAAAVGSLSPSVNVSDNGTAIATVGRIGMIVSAVLAMGPAVIPVAAAVAAALAGIGVGALAGVAGVGTLLLGLSGIFAGLKALDKPAAASAGGGAGGAAAAQAAANQVLSAQRALEQANFRVADSETALARAQRTAQQAQEALSAARKRAKEDLEDLGNKVIDNALDQRQAALDLAQAQRDAAALNGSSRATGAQRAAGELALAQAQQRSNELALEGARLADERADAQAKGVDSADIVVTATEKAADAQVDLAKAQRDVFLAVQDVQDSQLRLAQAYQKTADVGVAGAGAQQNAFDKLSPTAQRFVRFLHDTFIPALAPLKDAAQAALLPAMQTALEGLIPLIPSLVPLVSELAGALGGMFRGVTDWIAGPDGQQFIQFLTDNLPGWLGILGQIVGSIAGGFAGLLQAFAPVATAIGQGLADWAQGFSDVGESDAFTGFIDYLMENGPKIAGQIWDIVGAVKDIVVAFAPFGGAVLAVLGFFARAISAIPSKDLKAIVTIIGIVAAAVFVLNAALLILSANPIVLVIAAIIILIAALALGFVLLWNHSETFRDIVTGVFNTVLSIIQTVWGWISDNWKLLLTILTGPIGEAVGVITGHWDSIKSGFTSVKDWISDRIDDILGFFQGLGGSIKDAISGVSDIILGPFKAAFNGIATAWNNSVGKLSFEIPSWVPGVGGKGFDVPDIPEWKAAGGPVSAYKPYIVGEVGPELFVPKMNGTIIPNHALKSYAAGVSQQQSQTSVAKAGSTFNVYPQAGQDERLVAAQVDRLQRWEGARR